ncbi:MAG: SPOR domain-containing protein [Agarilytica sp.]
MDDGLKQRLIGAFVLLALGVIFIPVIFDRERIEPVDKRTQIPAAPYIEPVVIESVTPPVVEHVAEPAKEMYEPDDSVEQSLEPEVSGVDAQGVPNSWVLQIASFRFDKHATDFRDKLVADGFSAYTRNVDTDRGEMTRVYVGPKIDKNVLLTQKKKIEEKHKVSTILLKFEP